MCEYLRYASTFFRNVSLAKSLENYQPIHRADRDCFLKKSFSFSKEKLEGLRTQQAIRLLKVLNFGES